MPSTFCNLLIHVVFSTKRREPWMTGEMQPRLYEYIGGVVHGENGRLIEIGGTADHVHLLISWRTDESVAVLMRNLKSHSSGWIHQTFPALGGFQWQEGYGVFSVSASQEGRVGSYIQNQAQHHKRLTFQEEFERFLRAHRVEYDRGLLWGER